MRIVRYIVLSLLLVVIFTSVLLMVNSKNYNNYPLLTTSNQTKIEYSLNNNADTNQTESQIITSTSTILKYGIYISNTSTVYIYLNLSFTKISIINVIYVKGGPIMTYNGISEIQNSTLAKILLNYKNITITVFNGKYYNITLPIILTQNKLQASAFFYPENSVIPF